MGRIPHFRETIFPSESLPFLNLIATLGLVFFLFQVGLEVDMRIVKRDWKQSVSVAFAGMALPFGLGACVSLGLYKLQGDNSIAFSSFVLFLGVAMAITAFPVLARIMAELKLLHTRVGAITMAAGLLNDCTAWVLLALVVALLNSSGGLQSLYVFLTTVAFALFLIFLIAPIYRKLCMYTNSFEAGPSPLLMFVTIIIVLISAFVTDIIGVHAIFGGFLAGVIVPHDNDLAIKITEKFEDFVNILFLPLYFTLSGLKTQIGLLNTGAVWGYVILVIVIACVGKIAGCAIAGKATGLSTRESFTIGFLMSCKGLVELIVLNIGHDAGVLNDQIFVIMVVMALVTTFMTTPVVMWLYPEWYQKQMDEKFNNDQDSVDFHNKIDPSVMTASRLEPGDYFSLVTMMNRIDTVPSMMALIRLLQDDSAATKVKKVGNKNQLGIHVLRLLELTQRASDVMKIQDMRETQRQDPVLNVLRTFTSLIGIESLQTRLDFRSPTEFISTVSRYGESVSADMILLPWVGTTSRATTSQLTPDVNPLEQLASGDWSSSYQMSDADFASSAYSIKHCTVGLFIDRGFGHIQDGNPKKQTNFQIIVPFSYGGPDDRAALLFALRLQIYRQAEVLVLRPTTNETSTVLYATPESIHMTLNSGIQSISDQDLLDTLFVETESSNVVLRSVPHRQSNTELYTVLDSLEKPLGRHDLVVLGRSISSGHKLPSHLTPTPAADLLSPTHYSRGFKSALGNTAYQILSAGTLASLVVIQAQTDNLTTREV
ncbi:MAG: Sodium/hydrogen exchanger family-domain-containing protein [Benjaminiella poitrasii]|nr:MAG: Sodium/hydrogen exchanger family-domain-containing protein [Benjaminiella poitrasii]